MRVSALRVRPAWAALEKHYHKIKDVHLRQLFAEDRERGESLAVEAAGIYFDYSKNRITDETLRLLLQLAQESGLREHIDAMFRGDKINLTEDRAVLHVALRAPRGASIVAPRVARRSSWTARTWSDGAHARPRQLDERHDPSLPDEQEVTRWATSKNNWRR
jgi:hypothetical protein